MSSRSKWIIAGIAGAIVIACACVAILGAVGGLTYIGLKQQAPQIQKTFVSSLPKPQEPSKEQTPVFPTTAPRGDAAEQTLNTLEISTVPNNDPRELAERLKGIKNIPQSLDTPPVRYKIGDEQQFWVTNVDTNKNFQVDMVLQYVADHTYVWVQKGVRFNQNELNQLGDTFENKIYPTDRKFFGSEWTPGVDNDPHIYILFAGDLGGSLLGYFSSVDELLPQAHPYSNAHEMIFLNSDNQSLGPDAYSTLAHEFQHMIHWYRDRNEESWMNEGYSVLAELLNNFDPGGYDQLYAANPDQSLNDWPNDPNATTPYYGSAFLFVTYLLDRFGDQTTQAVIANPANGLDSIDKVLKDEKISDAKTGQPVTADDVFQDWVVANYLEDGNVGDGRYAYKIYPRAPKMDDTEEVTNCPEDWQTRTVHQYGVDYIRISCSGKVTLNFEGSKQVGVLAEKPHSGSYAFWSNKGDESDMTLSRTFDFSTVSGPIQMNYWTWYDLEKDYDFLYLEASTDGQTWNILKTPSCTTNNISGNSYGCGYNGTTDGWIQETADLSKYAGKKVQLRFEYVTDAAVNGEGLLLDDVSVPAVNYKEDFETGDGGWQAAGFVRIENQLPQSFRLSLIRQGSTTTVESLALDPSQKSSVTLDFGQGLRDAVLVVSGTTRFTRQEATYRFALQP